MGLVTLKSYQSGIALHLDVDADFNELLEEIGTKFEESRKFFKNANVAISLEDRILTDDEEKEIIRVIQKHSDVNVICIVGRDLETNKRLVKALKKVESQRDENNTRLYVGDVQADDLIESEGSLVIYGNVDKGGAVVAKNDVIVMGTINGQVYAGASGNIKSKIICFGLNPTTINIGKIKYIHKPKHSFGKKTKFAPQMLLVEDDEVVCDVLDEETIRDLLK